MPLGSQHVDRIAGRLWPDEDHAAFVLLDGAGIPNLLDKLYDEDGPQFECLYMGDLAPDMAHVVPYLARLERGSHFTDWVFSGWGLHWGILAVLPANLDIAAVRRHFRKLNIVYGPNGSPLLFRYYDPRVLPTFAGIADDEQLKQLFGPTQTFITEGNDDRSVRILSLANGKLVQETLALK